MFKWLGNLVDSNEKVLKKLQPVVDKINELEPEYEKLSDDELKAKTQEFKDRLAQATVRFSAESRCMPGRNYRKQKNELAEAAG